MEARRALDAEMIAWADGLTQADLGREVHWFSGDEERRPSHAFCVLHLFDHQAHHRGQIHGMLTMARARPEPTDLHVAPVIGRQVLGLPEG